ncbi:hypothetical protein [Ammoniphilus resinae]|uniref:Uncharacterized protein n=1 Tax=Ammoniphilus resinae TaxID=861532 RepID=A0ABS4GRJ4_9BACL|nr:hypothetical protein [Ammoniphilus resinae]MBP1932895.1 hypothetical protein [Ammoniphilus resinae]
MINKMIRSAIMYFFIILIIGIVLRWKMVAPIFPQWQFTHLVHAHSHVAFLGWVYFSLISLLFRYVLPKELVETKRIRVFYYLTHVAVIGMLISFSLQGYAPFSIAFSTLHILLSYYFVSLYIKFRRKDLPPHLQLFFGTGVFFMAFSSVGPWGLAVVSSLGLAHTKLFDTFIYLYLHLQYNGWFTFIIMGTCYHMLDRAQIQVPAKIVRWQYLAQTSSVLPSFFASILWFNLPPLLEWLGIAGALFQLIGGGLFLSLVWKPLGQLAKGKPAAIFLHISLLSLGVKAVMESVGAYPEMATMIYGSRQVILGYLHLTLIGFVSLFLMYYLGKDQRQISAYCNSSIILMLGGSIGMILFLFFAGLLEWLAYPLQSWIWILLLITSLLIFIGLSGMTLSSFFSSETKTQKKGQL